MSTSSNDLPSTIADVDELERLLSEPSEAAIAALRELSGDMILLGVAGKMGPTLAKMARRASEAAGLDRRIIGVSRFSDAKSRDELERIGVETIAGDLLQPEFVESLPDAPLVIYMAGMKFGATGNESMTWAMNAWLPSLVCRKYRRSRIAAFSTGNVYGLMPIDSGGSVESDLPAPVGEYAMSCLGRERMFEYFSRTLNIPTVILRLNYAHELRYGVLVDLAQKVHAGEEIDLSMGYVNVIWQGDANAMTLAALADAASPPFFLNLAGPERLSVREVCEQFGRRMDKPVRFTGSEATDALLNNGSRGHRRYGAPRIGAEAIIRWVADWVARGGPTLSKPTHFEVRTGKF